MSSQSIASRSPSDQMLQILMRSQTQVERSNQRVEAGRRDTVIQLESLMGTMKTTLLAKTEENNTLTKTLLVAENQIKELQTVHANEKRALQERVTILEKRCQHYIVKNISICVEGHDPVVKKISSALKGLGIRQNLDSFIQHQKEAVEAGNQIETHWSELRGAIARNAFSQLADLASQHGRLIRDPWWMEAYFHANPPYPSMFNSPYGMTISLNAQEYEGIRTKASQFSKEITDLCREAAALARSS